MKYLEKLTRSSFFRNQFHEVVKYDAKFNGWACRTHSTLTCVNYCRPIPYYGHAWVKVVLKLGMYEEGFMFFVLTFTRTFTA